MVTAVDAFEVAFAAVFGLGCAALTLFFIVVVGVAAFGAFMDWTKSW